MGNLTRRQESQEDPSSSTCPTKSCSRIPWSVATPRVRETWSIGSRAGKTAPLPKKAIAPMAPAANLRLRSSKDTHGHVKLGQLNTFHRYTLCKASHSLKRRLSKRP